MSAVKPRRGRPPAYRDEFANLARNLCLMGHATEDELGVLFGVSSRSIRTWKRQYPDFARAIEEGTLNPNARVTGALFDQCMQGNVTAIIWWQKNKMGWRDRIDTIAKIGVSPIDDLLSEIEGTTFTPKSA